MKLPHDEARTIQKNYYRDYGTTMNGLINLHGIDPNEFLEKVHVIDYSWVKPNRNLGAANPRFARAEIHFYQW